MKTIFLLILITSICILGHAQDIPAKAKTIVITFPDSNNLIKKVTKVLSDKDYKVKTGKNIFILSTDPKTLKNTRVTLTTTIKGADVFLNGKIFIAGQEGLTIENKGSKGTPAFTAWEEMDKVAKAMGGKLKYE